MFKKIMVILTIFSLAFAFLACTEDLTTLITTTEGTTSTTEEISIEVNTHAITIIVDETYQLIVTSNDVIGLDYSVNVEGVISLSDTGFITALAEGDAMITITSMSDESVYEQIAVIVRKQIVLTTDSLSIRMTEGETHQLAITSNDDYEFEVTNEDIVSVDEEGLVTAKTEGTTTVVVTSTYDPEVNIVITIIVDKLITISAEKDDYVLVVGDTEMLAVTSNDGLTYQSGNSNIVTVSETGEITAIGFGTTIIRIRSTYDEEVFIDVDVMVYKYTEEILIEGTELLINGMETQLTINASPVGSFNEVTWESSDESILTVNEFGVVTAITSGSATIIARSVLDTEIADTHNITVVNVLIVDSTKEDGDTYIYETLELQYGVQLFGTLQEALNNATEDTIIYIDAGTYSENVTVSEDGISLIGLNDQVFIDGVIEISADSITLTELNFINTAQVMNINPISDFVFTANIVSDIVRDEASFILLNDSSNTSITNNTFQRLSVAAVEINDFKGALTKIESNVFDTCMTAIKLDAVTALDSSSEVKIYWNTITNVELAFSIDMLVDTVEQDIFKAARFNNVTEYTNAVNVNPGSEFDFTLNYWGTDTLDYLKFVNVDSYYLKGNYADAATMPTKTTYNPALPIIITITNPIEEIMIGESHQFEYEILPYELQDAPVRFITGNPDIIFINQEGLITPLSSGDVYIQIRSAVLSTIRTQVDFRVITTPGVEITTTNVYSSVQVGDSFTLGYILFPYTIEGETATITSSAPTVASIDAGGVVNCNGEGLVTFRATLDSDPDVYVEYTLYVHGALDPDNSLLDYITTLQISYSEVHDWTAYGFQYDYHDTRAESVSRYYFGTATVNTSKIVPVSNGIRPGEPFDTLPEGVDGYNPYNLYWIVVHDTASTALGSNALAHANYLYNNAVAGVELWVSWHFTVDDTLIYQHLPEVERGYHAGDGSTLPTQGGIYLGGGNRNGIGIEMAINEDGDLYRTWQRTAKLVSYLLEKYGLPVENQRYHNDFSGKDCPRTLRNAGLVPLFEQFVLAEYTMITEYAGAEFTFTSNNPEYLDNHGRIIKIPERALTVSYTIEVSYEGTTESRTFYTYIPGTVR